LNRLIGHSCTGTGGTWSQAFAFNDAYDNVTKTGTGLPSWNPGYSPTTNHYTCSGCTYDSNGNVTNDGTTAYTWDAFSKMASVGSTSIISDAFGRVVEFDDGSSQTQIWYSPIGKTFMHGATYNHEYISSPGGGTIFHGGSTYYMHSDWIGSARIVSLLASPGTVYSDRAFAPYGELFNIFGGTNEILFAGLTQDIFSGMYDTPNREMTAVQSRFMSPDPAGAGWNAYAWPTNPNSASDPSGLGPLPNGGPAIPAQPIPGCAGTECLASTLLNPYNLAMLEAGAGSIGPGLTGGGTVAADFSPCCSTNNAGSAGQMVGTFGAAPMLYPGYCDGSASGCDLTVPETVLTSQAATGVADATAFDISFQITNYVIREPNPYVTAATDVAGIIGIIAPKVTGKLHLGIAGAMVSSFNDPSYQNWLLNALSLVDGFDGPLAINSAFTDAFDYKMNSDPVNILEDSSDMVIPATVSNGEASFPNQDLAPCGGWCQ
jgi:RHS repeat-associated protein